MTSESDEKIKGYLALALAVVGLPILIYIGYQSYRQSYIQSELKKLGQRCLATQTNVSCDIYDKLATATFHKDELVNTANVSYDGKFYEFHDFNKSKIIGLWAGEKVIEFMDGFKRGKSHPRKHRNYDDDK